MIDERQFVTVPRVRKSGIAAVHLICYPIALVTWTQMQPLESFAVSRSRNNGIELWEVVTSRAVDSIGERSQ